MAELTLKRLGRTNLVDEIVEQLEAEIVKGSLHPGDQLPPERDLCDQLGVSRTSLRTAVQRLAERGLLSVEVGRGTFVRRPSSRELSDRIALSLRLDESSYWQITEARHIVEPDIAALAAARRQEADTLVMRDALERMEAAMGDAVAYIDSDEGFHLALAAASQNDVLAALSQNLQSMLRQVRQQVFSIVKVSARAQQYHWQIYEAVVRGADDEARTAMNGHLNEMETYIRSRLTTDESSSQDGQ